MPDIEQTLHDIDESIRQKDEGLVTTEECFNFIADRVFRALERIYHSKGPFERIAESESLGTDAEPQQHLHSLIV